MYNWWQGVIAVLVFCTITFFVSRWTMPTPVLPTPSIGTPDTIFVPQPAIVGYDSSIVRALVKENKILKKKLKNTEIVPSATPEVETYDLFEKEISEYTPSGDAHVQIRARAYVFRKDSAAIAIEWNIEPRPCEEIVRVDTVYIPKTVMIQAKVPFYKKPLFVASAAAVGVLIIEGILRTYNK